MTNPDRPPRAPHTKASDATSNTPATPTVSPAAAKTPGPGAVGYSLYDPAHSDRQHGPGYCGWTATTDTGSKKERR